MGVIDRGLLWKAARELWPATLLFGLAIFLVETVLSYVLPTFQTQLSAQWAQIKFVQAIVQAMLGTDAASGLGPEIFLSIPWVHPVVLAIVWAHAISCATRVPAGEVDRGTMDVLLGLPVSRREVFLSESAATFTSVLIVLALAWLGNATGSKASSVEVSTSAAREAIVLVNLLCLYLAVGAFAGLISAVSDRRGKAIAVAFVLVLASFLLNYLAQFWEPAKRVAFLSVVGYYRPLFVLRDGAWPLRDIAILAATAVVAWLSAGIIFSRRDLSTV
jgi:ABC-type transport system involved in multi-copper enzyme maturation permease subunit